jgi:hypothetical protein
VARVLAQSGLELDLRSGRLITVDPARAAGYLGFQGAAPQQPQQRRQPSQSFFPSPF